MLCDNLESISLGKYVIIRRDTLTQRNGEKGGGGIAVVRAIDIDGLPVANRKIRKIGRSAIESPEIGGRWLGDRSLKPLQATDNSN